LREFEGKTDLGTSRKREPLKKLMHHVSKEAKKLKECAVQQPGEENLLRNTHKPSSHTKLIQ